MAEGLFPAAEFETRVARMQRQMAAAGQDALLLTTPADVFYVTGFLTRFWESPARPWYILVPVSGAPIAVIPAIGAALMGRSWITDMRTWDAPNPADDGVSLLCDAICEQVPTHGALGIPMGLETHLRMPLADYLTCTAKIAPRRIVDATDTVQRTREIKSAAEIAKIKASCAIADRAFDRVATFAQKGRPLDAVFRDFQIALLSEGADWVSYVAGGAGQGGYGDVISPASDRALQDGDTLMLDTGAVRDGYFCDFDRNFAIGTPDDAARRAYDVAYQATDAALSALHPGMTAAELHHVMCQSILSQGARPGGGRLGHGLGITLTEWPSLTPHDHTPLRAGMVLTLEPGVEIAPGKIMVHEENIVLTAAGAQLLSRRAPPALPEIHR
ncbi:aminopeptidase P family protein [Loktanella sp. D2R18]|uniref:M24 family metallopeptidase n=1 Tax=Rhodobacterales TaxID=204455 RepID=UPI000DE941D2|nr:MULTISPECIES: Xaa-Pro peptidase family protein [Rhodobacterales]MDO6591661.1 Xaa-Pro peptidase family protein [Yoonia sp. 1_MG-2023]RBW42496.1 aminopeptidase P family protein [Loktanella sp. D2R18]